MTSRSGVGERGTKNRHDMPATKRTAAACARPTRPIAVQRPEWNRRVRGRSLRFDPQILEPCRLPNRSAET